MIDYQSLTEAELVAFREMFSAYSEVQSISRSDLEIWKRSLSHSEFLNLQRNIRPEDWDNNQAALSEYAKLSREVRASLQKNKPGDH